ncbi:MAG: hypothetical protein V1734_06555 [Nanoarchaeota archaeon]
MKKSRFILFWLLLVTLTAIPPICATSMAGISPSRIDIPFFPNAEQRIDFRTTGYDAAELEFKCPYVHPINETLNDEDRAGTFSVILKLPDKIDAEPGDYDCRFMLHRPKDPNMPPGVGASAEIGVLIFIKIPVKGKYATISLTTDNVNKEEPVYFKTVVNNLGDTALKEISAVIDVTDIDGNIKETLYTTQSDVEPFASTELWKRMETTDYEPARYNAKATMIYGGEKPAYAETSFLIGKLFVKFLGLNINATENKINPFSVDVESWWGDPIENARAEISLFNASGVFKGNFRTESVDLSPWQKATLQGYWDANGFEAGDYDANVTLRYKGGETSEIVKVVLHKQPEELKKNMSFDKIAEVLVSPAFLIILVLILVINVGVWMLKKKKKAAQ